MNKMARVPATVAQLLNPRSVAVVGASEDQGKFGGRLYRMLIKHGFTGAIYPINPRRDSLFGIKAFPSVADTPEAPDMVVMALPRDKVKAEIQSAVARGARGGIIITAKFSDAGDEGAVLEREIVASARAGAMRLIGPNCLGIISPANKVVLCSSPALDVDALPVGSIGFVSQSGALMATLFDRAMAMGIGFSHCVSVGNQADLELCDFVEYLVEDDRTKVICTYIEGVRDPTRFAAVAARARKAGKPWLAVKAGRTSAGSRAAFSHTASIAGDHAVLAAVCREENVTLMEDPAAMIVLAAVMAGHPGATSGGVAIITTSGGGGALAADALSARGLALAEFGPTTRAKLDELYSPGQALNPIDFGGRRFEEAVTVAGVTARTAAADEGVGALLFAITTAPMLPRMTEDIVVSLREVAKPAFYVMEPGRAADGARDVLRAAETPFTDSLGEAVEAIGAWTARCGYQERAVAVRPQGCAGSSIPHGSFDEATTKTLLASYGIRVNESHLSETAAEAVEAANRLGYPVVMKIVSPDIVHKSDIGGVAIGLGDAPAVATAFQRIVDSARNALPDVRIAGVSVQAQVGGRLELIVGARRDAQFGPVVVFGAGGVLVELLPERAIARAPLAAADVRARLSELGVWPVLEGYRGRKLAVDAVVDTIVRTSWLAADLSESDFELDINPLIVGEDACCAVDARLRVGPAAPE